MRSGKEKGRFQVGGKAVRALAFAPDGRKLAAGTVDGMLTVWGLPELRRLGGVVKGHAAAVSALAFDGDGKLLASGSSDGTVVVWEATSGRPRLRLRQYRSAVHALALSDDGKLLAAGVEAGVQVVDATRGVPLQTMPLGRVTAVRFTAAGKEFQFLLTQTTPSNWRGTVRVTATATAGRPRLEASPVGLRAFKRCPSHSEDAIQASALAPRRTARAQRDTAISSNVPTQAMTNTVKTTFSTPASRFSGLRNISGNWFEAVINCTPAVMVVAVTNSIGSSVTGA